MQEPLVEEYVIASQILKLNRADLCELARNSVHISGFPHDVSNYCDYDYYDRCLFYRRQYRCRGLKNFASVPGRKVGGKIVCGNCPGECLGDVPRNCPKV